MDNFQPGDSALIPIYNKKKEIVAYAKVTPSFYEEAMQHTWYIGKGKTQRYARYCLRPGGRKGKLVTVFLHRMVLGVPSYENGLVVDHINGDPLDNRYDNLRIVSRNVNAQNAKLRSDNSSGYRGITFSKEHNRWRVRIQKDLKSIEIGLFSDIADAVIARDNAIKTYYNYYVRFS